MKISLKTSSTWTGVGEIGVGQFPFILGRHEGVDGLLPFAFVSRRHCRLTLENDQLFVQDLDSHNGTFVNGRRIDNRQAIKHGDRIDLGPLSLSVIADSPAGNTLPDCSSAHNTSEIALTAGATSTALCPYQTQD
jgi:pSer/pThr/pTyr-binding forkhead associated (FHA) protein